MNVLHVVGARPNFMKAAPVLRALQAVGVTNVLVHTGQHYDAAMSDTFFSELDLPTPDVHLEVGSDSHAVQTAKVMERFEPVLLERAPDLTLVYGDVNSTLAAALVCAKLGARVGHVEAGLRSFDRTMPEEINRLVTDQLSDLLFTTSPEAEGNLAREGVDTERIHFVGNTMIDTLLAYQGRARDSHAVEDLGLAAGEYVLVTLHRPANVDDPVRLKGFLSALEAGAGKRTIVFPIHPRTRAVMRDNGLETTLRLIEPQPYLRFLDLMSNARVVLTDSGGIQEETTILGVPCLTARDNTERPITVEMGTNRLVGADPARIGAALSQALEEEPSTNARPPLWDGKAADRIAAIVTSS
jgi:UDP-N-acetylglucosamine 2-epimerase (non-hydrolysing)